MVGMADLIESLAGFEWDAGNSEKNWKRHQVSQAECEQVFSNLPLLLSIATQGRGGEPRYVVLGRTDGMKHLTVVSTVRGHRVRAIFARPMSRRERREYQHAQATSEEAGS
jgi:uncharacterized DUF497 family protein